jgi:NADH:ubiquinone oxidoreductase subunit K
MEHRKISCILLIVAIKMGLASFLIGCLGIFARMNMVLGCLTVHLYMNAVGRLAVKTGIGEQVTLILANRK